MQPIWKPLEEKLGRERCGGFMYMGRVNGINLYKHGMARMYVNLDDSGQCYVVEIWLITSNRSWNGAPCDLLVLHLVGYFVGEVLIYSAQQGIKLGCGAAGRKCAWAKEGQGSWPLHIGNTATARD